jgi:hypothetical protein
LLDFEGLDELVKEAGYSVRQLDIGHLGRQSLNNLTPASLNQFNSVSREEIV